MYRSAYTGTNAKGALIGIPTILHHILLLCNDCLSVANACKIVDTLLSSRYSPGYSTSILLFPLVHISLRLSVNVGNVFNPHSSKGILRRTLLPQTVSVFCQPVSFRSHAAHVSFAFEVTRSAYVRGALGSCAILSQ